MAGTAGTDIAYVGPRISLAQGGKSANGDRGDRLAHYNNKINRSPTSPRFKQNLQIKTYIQHLNKVFT